ncbi:MAG: threonylcarbamoyl-AMP synthase [Selenomonadaceae bacterium]|nr:threonylcarbamoyl-AMP synthase [Selenomonadaceae bacterium]
MYTQIIKITDINGQTKDLQKAGDIIKGGGLVAFPTETVYGLGASGFDEGATTEIYRVKGRPSDNPLILHVAEFDMVASVAEVTPLAQKLLTAFCPGPLTLVMKRKSTVPDCITGGLKTVGVRWPDNEIAQAFIKAAGVPIAAPSANLSGRPSPTTAEAVRRDLEGRIPLILDGGSCRFGLESTIVDCTEATAVILRPGAVTREMIAEVVGEVRLDPGLVGKKNVPKAPGMKYTHYAPKAPLTLVEASPEKMKGIFRRELRRLQKETKVIGVIVSDELANFLQESELVPPDLIVSYGQRENLTAIAANLYASLRYFDDKAVEQLLAEGTADTGLGLAIMNRLRKAAGFRVIKVDGQIF